MSQLDFAVAADALFGPYEPPKEQGLEAEGAVDTGAGITASLTETPSMVSGQVQQSLGHEPAQPRQGFSDYCPSVWRTSFPPKLYFIRQTFEPDDKTSIYNPLPSKIL
jgi:hypothetical protein